MLRRPCIRRWIILCLILLLVPSLCGCNLIQSSSVYSEINNASELSMVCSRYSGTKQTSLSVSDSSSATLNGVLSITKGSCAVHVTNDSGGNIYSGENISASTNFCLLLDGPATYYITVDCSRMSGSFSFTWDFVGSAPTIAIPDEFVDPEADAQPPASNTGSAPDSGSNVSTDVWSGSFHCETLDAHAEIELTDTQFFAFRLTRGDLTYIGVAQISAETPSVATYTGGDGITLSFYRSGSLLEVTQTGQCDTLAEDLTGDYLIEIS